MNNQVYLKKLIRQERLNAKIELVREHARIAKREIIEKQNRLLESANRKDLKQFLTETTTTMDPAIDPALAKPNATIQSNAPEADKLWKNQEDQKLEWSPTNATLTQAESFLKDKLGGTVKKHGINPVSYEVQQDLGKIEGKEGNTFDRFRFYSDQSVYSYNTMRRLGWTLNGDKIEIYNFGPNTTFKIADKVLLATIDKSGKFTNIAWEEAQKDAEEAKSKGLFGASAKTMDIIQTILDFAGLIPVIGDAIDAINAVMYFLREKYFDGFLSLIAIIPVVGSVIKLGVKGAVRAAKATKLAKAIRTMWLKAGKYIKGGKSAAKEANLAKELWLDMIKSGAVTADQLKSIGHGFENIQKTLRGAKRGVRKIPLVNTKPVEQTLKQADDFLGVQAKGIDELNAALKATGDAATALKTGETAVSAMSKNRKFLGRMYDRTKQMGVFNPKQLQRIQNKVERNFVEKMNHPNKMPLLIKFAPDSKVLMTKLDDTFLDMAVNLKKSNPELLDEYLDLIKSVNPNAVGKAGPGKVAKNPFEILSPNEIKEVWTKMHADPKKWGDISQNLSETVAKHTQANHGFAWEVFKQDEVNKLFASQSVDVQGLQIGMRKNLDIISNELTDVAEDFGLDPSGDDPNGVIWPLAYYAVNQQWPGSDLEQTAKDIEKFTDKVGDAGAAAVENTLGIPLNQYKAYDITADDYTFDPTKDK